MPGARTALEAATSYFELVQASDVDGVVALFADDAEMVPAPRPEPGSWRGREAIAAHYRSVLAKPIRFQELQFHEAGPSCAVEIRAEVGVDRRLAELVDVFTVDDDGRVTRLSVYRR